MRNITCSEWNLRPIRDEDFLGIIAFLGQKVHYSTMISSDDCFFYRDHCIFRTKSAFTWQRFQVMTFFLEITLNLGRKLVLNTMIIGLKIRISHRIFFLPVKYCLSYSLTTHKIPDCMTRFWHANCITSLRGHRTPLQEPMLTQSSFKP